MSAGTRAAVARRAMTEKSSASVPRIEDLGTDLLTAVLVLMEEDVYEHVEPRKQHAAISKCRRVSRFWKELIDTDGFNCAWTDVRCTLSSRERRELLTELKGSDALSHKTSAEWQIVAGLIREMRFTRIPRIYEPMYQNFDHQEHGEVEERCHLIVVRLHGLLMVASFTHQQELNDTGGYDAREGFSLHAWAGDGSFQRVLAVTTLDRCVDPEVISGYERSHAGTKLAPLRYVNRMGLDLVCAAVASAGKELSSPMLLATICLAAAARSGCTSNGVNAWQDEAAWYVRVVVESADTPTVAPFQHMNVSRGKHDGELLPGLQMLYWDGDADVDTPSGPSARMMLSAELDYWQPGIAKEWQGVARGGKSVKEWLRPVCGKIDPVWPRYWQHAQPWPWDGRPPLPSIMNVHPGCFKCMQLVTGGSNNNDMGDSDHEPAT